MASFDLAPPSDATAAHAAPAVPAQDARARIAALVSQHYDFIWRSLRRLGVAEANVDDAAQKVFLVALRRLDTIAVGSEQPFLFGTAMRIAADARRTAARAREMADDAAVAAEVDPAPTPEELADNKRAREKLDEVLDTMPIELRTVFVLFELEEMTMAEIAALVAVPPGTVASRLRRARELFVSMAARLRARASRARGGNR
jgi:RNA polymerase sigma-70 factor (ECF subfamily)